MGTIVAFGDSWTTGLNKPNDQRYHVTPFVEHIANYLGYDLINYGVDGNSNPAIASDILAHDFKEDEFALVSWSGLTRDWDWSDKMKFVKPNLRIRDVRPHDLCYYMSEFSIRAAENYLTKNSINYIMTSAFVEHFVIRSEQWDSWLPGTLKEHCEDQLEICQHPNAEGHSKIAAAIIKDVEERTNERKPNNEHKPNN